jgi:hypothetical protein
VSHHHRQMVAMSLTDDVCQGRWTCAARGGETRRGREKGCGTVYTRRRGARMDSKSVRMKGFVTLLLWELTLVVDVHSTLRGNAFPSEPHPVPKIPSGHSDDYTIPQYPLPPRPAMSPPPTMPFAQIDFQHMNGFVPPHSMVGKVNPQATLREGENTQDAQEADKASEPGSDIDGSNIPYEAPPITDAKSIGQTPGMDGTFELRKDSANPYCNFCIAFVNTNSVEGACKQFPDRSQENCQAIVSSLASNADMSLIKKDGCIDRTGPMAIVKKTCPGIVTCNLVKAGNGSPLCGTVFNSWGMYKQPNPSPHPSAKNVEPAPYAPPPSTLSGSNNPYCEMCAVYMNAADADRTNPTKLCESMSVSQQDQCLSVAKELRFNAKAKSIISKGCVDITGPKQSAVKTPCPGIVACNLMEDGSGGPMCGTALGQWGSTEV